MAIKRTVKNHRAYLNHRLQCNRRNELYELSPEDFLDLFTDETWSRRQVGAVDRLCLVRKDNNKPWRRDNIELITYAEQRVRKWIGWQRKEK